MPAVEARVTARGAKRWARGHPWIYEGDVTDPPGPDPGPVGVLGPDDRLLGSALWSPASRISLRMLTRSDRPIDVEFWSERLAAALRYREARGLVPSRDSGFRLVHGEADGMPSLIVDWYAGVLVVQFLSAGLERCRADLVAALSARVPATGILARNDAPVRTHERLDRTVEVLAGDVPDEVEIVEAGVRCRVSLRGGQKTGAFLDQRENRVLAGELARGRSLDVFCYQGGFAMHLAGGGAAEVVAVDASAEAVDRTRQNARLNALDQRIRAVEANAFDFLRNEAASGARYDVIVVDPPAFAKRRGALKAALRGYKEINLRAMRLLEPGGHLLPFSCSQAVDLPRFQATLRSAAGDSGRRLRWVQRLGQATDHPEIVQIPETGYLKGVLLQAAPF